MSRLESMRRRISAQIDGINWAADMIKDIDGDVLEMGLGNGRTYDHLRQEIPNRRIWVIDRVLKPHPSCIPPEGDFLQGEADEMLAQLARTGHRMALTHYEFGHGDKEVDAAEGRALSPFIASVMVPGGLVVSQQPMIGLEQIKGPDTVHPDRYLFYRAP